MNIINTGYTLILTLFLAASSIASAEISEAQEFAQEPVGFALWFDESHAEVVVSEIKDTVSDDGFILSATLAVQLDEDIAHYNLLATASLIPEMDRYGFNVRLHHQQGTSTQTIKFDGREVRSQYDFDGEQRSMIYDHIDMLAVLDQLEPTETSRTLDFPLHEVATRAMQEVTARGMSEFPVQNLLSASGLLVELSNTNSLSAFSPLQQLLFDVKGTKSAVVDTWLANPGLVTPPKGNAACKTSNALVEKEEGVANKKSSDFLGVTGEVELGSVSITAKALAGSGLAGESLVNGGFVLTRGTFNNKTCPDPFGKTNGTGFAVDGKLDALSRVLCTGKHECCTDKNDDVATGADWSLKFSSQGIKDSYADRKGNSTAGKTSIKGSATLCVGYKEVRGQKQGLYLGGSSKMSGRSYLN